jgi:predicted enzyme related to lactoylglutathione lyase
MHRSCLAGFIIDCDSGELDTAATFWGAALGMPASRIDSPDDVAYRKLDAGRRNLHIEVQRVDHPPRVHLDIEADDIEAEVRRLEALGARRVRQVRTWWVMEAPTGHRFCVVRVQSPDFEARANVWP